jgi:hypothetical protein
VEIGEKSPYFRGSGDKVFEPAKHKKHYRTLRRFSIMQSPVQQEETLGRSVRGDRLTGGRKAAREEAAGPSQKRRMARAIRQAIVSRAPTGMVKTGLFEAQS